MTDPAWPAEGWGVLWSDVSPADERRVTRTGYWLQGRRVALAVLVHLLVFAALAAWAVATPVGSSPDEDFHLASIWCGLGDREGLCESARSADERRVPAALVDSPCFKKDPTKTATCQDLDDVRLTTTKRVNSTNVYPPVYYAVTGIFASRSVATSVVTIRLFNAAVFVACGSALFFMLSRKRRPSLVLTWAATLVPLGIYLIPSVNPSSWAITGCATAWFAGVGFFESHGRERIGFGVLAVIGCVLAAGARADSAIYAILAVCAAWFAVGRVGRVGRGPRWVSLGLPALAIALGVAFVLFAGQAGVFTSGFGSKHGTAGFGLLFQNLLDVPELWLGSFGVSARGALGWFDIPVPNAAQAGAMAAFLCVAVWGLRGGSRRRLIVLAFWAALLLVIPLWVLQISHARVGAFIQPRYLYPLVILLVATAALTEGKFERPSTLQLVSLGGAAALANSAVLYGAIRRFTVVNQTRVDFSLSAHEKWWWPADGMPGPTAVWAIGSLAFAAILAVLLTRIALPESSLARSPRPDPVARRPRAHVRGRHIAPR